MHVYEPSYTAQSSSTAQHQPYQHKMTSPYLSYSIPLSEGGDKDSPHPCANTSDTPSDSKPFEAHQRDTASFGHRLYHQQLSNRPHSPSPSVKNEERLQMPVPYGDASAGTNSAFSLPPLPPAQPGGYGPPMFSWSPPVLPPLRLRVDVGQRRVSDGFEEPHAAGSGNLMPKGSPRFANVTQTRKDLSMYKGPHRYLSPLNPGGTAESFFPGSSLAASLNELRTSYQRDSSDIGNNDEECLNDDGRKKKRKRRRRATEEPRDLALRKFSCELCGKMFARPSALATHGRSHSQVKPHICPHSSCQRPFAVLSNLRRHQRVYNHMEENALRENPFSNDALNNDSLHTSENPDDTLAHDMLQVSEEKSGATSTDKYAFSDVSFPLSRSQDSQKVFAKSNTSTSHTDTELR